MDEAENPEHQDIRKEEKGMNASRFAHLIDPTVRKRHGSWLVRCPAHPDRHPSLSIKEGNKHPVVMYCRSNHCTTLEILNALGLQWADLTTDKPLDREAMKAIGAERQRAADATRNRRRIKLAALDAAGKWERVASQLGMLLARYPNDAKVGSLFDWSLNKMCQCEQIAVNFGSPGYGFPKMGRKAKLTRNDVGPKIAMRLGIYKGV